MLPRCHAHLRFRDAPRILFGPLVRQDRRDNDEGHWAIAVNAPIRAGITRAANLFMRAARNGNARAQFELGRMYLKGLGVEKDCAMTAAWIGKAAYQNLAMAQTLFATLYLKGLGVSQDNETAKSRYAKAANLGDVSA